MFAKSCAVRAFALAEKQDYAAASAAMGELVLSGTVRHAGLLKADLLANIVHDDLRQRPNTLNTVVNYAFFVMATAPADAIAELSALLARAAAPDANTILMASQRSAVLRMRASLSAANGADQLTALSDLQEALELDPSNVQCLYQQGKIFRALGRTEEARAALTAFVARANLLDVGTAKFELLVLHCKLQPAPKHLSLDDAQSLLDYLRRGLAEATEAETAHREAYGDDLQEVFSGAKATLARLMQMLEGRVKQFG